MAYYNFVIQKNSEKLINMGLKASYMLTFASDSDIIVNAFNHTMSKCVNII